MAGLGRRWSRRGALLGFLGAFLVVHVVGAVTDSFGVLLATRVVGALANAGVLAVALVAAADMVEPGAKGRATSRLLGGVTLACVIGVPAGALLGQLWGWRSAFWAVALLSLPALAAVARSVPAGAADGAHPTLRVELRPLRNRRLQLTLLLGALVNGATFCTFTYLAPLVTTHVTGLPDGWVPVVLALFGLGSFVGVSLGGRIADRRPALLLGAGGVALTVGWDAPSAPLDMQFVRRGPVGAGRAVPRAPCGARFRTRLHRDRLARRARNRASRWALGSVVRRSVPGSATGRPCGSARAWWRSRWWWQPWPRLESPRRLADFRSLCEGSQRSHNPATEIDRSMPHPGGGRSIANPPRKASR